MRVRLRLSKSLRSLSFLFFFFIFSTRTTSVLIVLCSIMLYLYLYLQLFILYTRMTCDFYLYICYRSTVYRRAVYVYNLLLAISLVLCIKYISILVLLCVYKLLLTDCDCLSTVLHCALPVHCTYVCRLLRGLPLLFLSLCQCTQHRAPYSRTVYIRSYTGFAVATAAAAGISSGTQIKYTTLAH